MDMRTVLDYFLHAPIAKARQGQGIAALILDERAGTPPPRRRRRSAPDEASTPAAESAAPPAAPRRRRRRTGLPDALTESDARLPDPEPPAAYGE